MNSLKHLIYLVMLTFSLSLTSWSAMAETDVDFTAAELDQMLAPIALYPDTVLSHVLIASTYPLEVVQADRWARNNTALKAEAAVAAVENQDWDPSVKALVAFPQILQQMSDDLAWTQRLGDAFLDSEARVMDAIQNLRSKAYASGSLDRLEHVHVQRDKEVIIIEPAVERVIYVPVYDTRVVYGNWWWNDYPPVYWNYHNRYTYVNGFYWGPRVHVSSNFYFSGFQWHRRHIVYVDYYRGQHPRFNNGRGIASYNGARSWRHNPTHRRGVAYHNDRVRQNYGSNRESYRSTQQSRSSQLRHNRGTDNRARQNLNAAERRSQTQQRDAHTKSDRVRERLSNSRPDTSTRTRDPLPNNRVIKEPKTDLRNNSTLPQERSRTQTPNTQGESSQRENSQRAPSAQRESGIQRESGTATTNDNSARQQDLQRRQETRTNITTPATTDTRTTSEARSVRDTNTSPMRAEPRTQRTSTEQRSPRVERTTQPQINRSRATQTTRSDSRARAERSR